LQPHPRRRRTNTVCSLSRSVLFIARTCLHHLQVVTQTPLVPFVVDFARQQVVQQAMGYDILTCRNAVDLL